jgi:hypothetical protein
LVNTRKFSGGRKTKRRTKLAIESRRINLRNSWRQNPSNPSLEAESRVSYRSTDKLELKDISISEWGTVFHDLDNRLKDIMDALQGRAGGSKMIRTSLPLFQMTGRSSIVIEVATRKTKQRFGHLIGDQIRR